MRITGILPTPEPEDYDDIGSQQARQFLASLDKTPAVPFAEMYPNACPPALEVMQQMLAFNPRRRLTVEQALQHPFFADLHDPKDEHAAPSEFVLPYHGQTLTKYQMKELIYAQIVDLHPELASNLETIKAQHQQMYQRQAQQQPMAPADGPPDLAVAPAAPPAAGRPAV